MGCIQRRPRSTPDSGELTTGGLHSGRVPEDCGEALHRGIHNKADQFSTGEWVTQQVYTRGALLNILCLQYGQVCRWTRHCRKCRVQSLCQGRRGVILLEKTEKTQEHEEQQEGSEEEETDEEMELTEATYVHTHFLFEKSSL